jgi:hypothetical protein
MANEIGAIYVSTGERYVRMAAISAKSFKAQCPNIPVHIFTDCDVSSYECFDSSTQIVDPNNKYGAKVDYFFESPYQKTLYLDADTKVCEDLTPMFELLDRCEMAIAHDPGRGKYIKKYLGQTPVGKGERKRNFISKAPSSFLPVNSGVILYKMTDSVVAFFKAWQKAFHEEGLENDQFTFRDQLWSSNLNFWILPPEYNCRPRGHIRILKNAMINPKILHLNDFKREAGIPPISSLTLSKKINHIFKHKLMPKIREIFQGSPY